MNISDPVHDETASKAIGFNKADHPNCSSILFDNLKRNPDALAITGPAGECTYKALCREAEAWGLAFQSAGLVRGERIAFFLDDGPTYAAAFFGAVRAGFVPVLLNTQTSKDLLDFFVEDSGARIALCDADFAKLFDDRQVDTLVVSNGDTRSDAIISAQHFIEQHSGELTLANTGPDDMAFWMYSSGSTGRPKGIVHLHHDMAYTIASYANHILNIRPEDRLFSVPKLFFAYGFGNGISFPFSAGACAVLMPGQPKPKAVLDTIEQYKPSMLFGLPTLYTALCNDPSAKERDLSSIRLSLSAAEILSEDVFNAWQELTGNGPVEGLGSTEMLHIYLSNSVVDKRLGSAGRVVPGYDVKLIGPDGQATDSGTEGTMLVRGHSSSPSYWNRDDKTADTMRGEWIYTGDLFIEKDSAFYFQGRADDLIKVSGQWVWPLEVEHCLAEHPMVHECAVLAHPLEDKRMTLRAVVKLREDQTGTADTTKALQSFVKSELIPYKYPRIVQYVSAMPHTGTGKIDRQALLNLTIEELL